MQAFLVSNTTTKDTNGYPINIETEHGMERKSREEFKKSDIISIHILPGMQP